MRKKFLAMYALVGALVASPIFTSCIDDTESESVTAVRNAKAEQQKIANQIAAAKAELQMQYDKLQLEANIANYEAKLLEYQLDLKENQAALDAYGVKTLSELTYAYTNALSYAAQSEWNILKYNKNIEDVKAGYLNGQKYLANEIDRKNIDIAAKEATIENLKEVQANGLDKTSIEAKAKELENAVTKAKKDYYELQAQYGIASPSETYDIKKAENLATIKAYNALTALATVSGRSTEGDSSNAGSTEEDSNTNSGTADETLPLETLPLIDTDADGFYYLNKSVVIEKQEELAEAIKEAKETLDNAVAAIGTDKDTEETTISEESEDLTLYAKLAQAKKELAEAGEDATEDQEEAVADAEKAIVKANDELVPLKKKVAAAEQASKDFEANIATFEGEDYEAYKAAVVALDAAEEAYTLANAEKNTYDSIYENIGEGSGLWYSVGEDSSMEYTVEDAIKILENDIENLKKDIAELNGYIYNGEVEVDSEETLAAIVAYIEKQIASEEAWLATYNKQAEEAKAALDAYLGTEEA